jgi:hypothetical protein
MSEAESKYPEFIPAPIYVAKYVFRFENTPSAVGPVTSIREVEFMPFGERTIVPGFTHRVLIDGLMKDWLGHGKPSAKSAEYFLRKHWGCE